MTTAEVDPLNKIKDDILRFKQMNHIPELQLLNMIETLVNEIQVLRDDKDNKVTGIVQVINSTPIDLITEHKLNDIENTDFGESMSEQDIEKHFKETPKIHRTEPNFSNMTIEEIESWEKEQDNSNDIYRIKGRIKNNATESGASILPAGEGLINAFAHMCKALYGFADTLSNPEEKRKLNSLIRKQEVVPGQIIATFTPTRPKE